MPDPDTPPIAPGTCVPATPPPCPLRPAPLLLRPHPHRRLNARPAHTDVVPAPSSGGLRPGCRRGPPSTREPVRSCTPPTAPCRRNLTRSIPPAGRTSMTASLRHCQGRPLQRPPARFGWSVVLGRALRSIQRIRLHPRPRVGRRKGYARGPTYHSLMQENHYTHALQKHRSSGPFRPRLLT